VRPENAPKKKKTKKKKKKEKKKKRKPTPQKKKNPKKEKQKKKTKKRKKKTLHSCGAQMGDEKETRNLLNRINPTGSEMAKALGGKQLDEKKKSVTPDITRFCGTPFPLTSLGSRRGS